MVLRVMKNILNSKLKVMGEYQNKKKYSSELLDWKFL